MPLLTRFNLRRDLVNRKLHNSFIGTVYTTKNHATYHVIERNYINSLLYHLNKLTSNTNNSNTNNCNCITKLELEAIISETINNKIIDVSKLEEISKSINDAKQTINDANTSITDAVYLLKNEELSLLNEIHDSITIINNLLIDLKEAIKTNSADIEKQVQASLSLIECKTQTTIDTIDMLEKNVETFSETVTDALSSINEEKDKAIAAIDLHNGDVITIKEELLIKINYIFQMFYHADSEFVINNYPLS